MGKHALITRGGDIKPLQVLGTQVRFLCQPADTNHSFSMMEVLCPRDAGPPLHHHDWDEAYYIADGEVRFILGTETQIVKRGDFVYAPAGTVHGFSGVSEAPSRILILDAPATAAAFFAEVDREVKVIPDDLTKVAV